MRPKNFILLFIGLCDCVTIEITHYHTYTGIDTCANYVMKQRTTLTLAIAAATAITTYFLMCYNNVVNSFEKEKVPYLDFPEAPPVRILLNKEVSSPISHVAENATVPLRKPNVTIPEHRLLSQNYQNNITTGFYLQNNAAKIATSTDPFGYTVEDDYYYEDENEFLDINDEEVLGEEVFFPLITPRQDILMYNPVPKTGSTSTADMLKRLSKRNGFFYEKLGDRSNNSRQYDPKSLDEFTHRVMENPRPSVMNRHIHFVNFTQLDRSGGPNPIYINSLRDPLDRFRSRYHYARQDNKMDWYFYDLYQDAEPMAVAGTDNVTWAAKDINDCVMDKHDRECNFQEADIIDHSIHHFCVEYGNLAALAEAKANIERYYTVVIIVEREEDSFKLLEKLIPNYFTGITTLKKASKNVGKKKKKILTRRVVSRLRHNLRFEQDLYDFALQRLDFQLRSLEIESENN